jgi:hypothetical protein
METTQQDYKAKLDSQMKQWNTKLEELKTKAAGASATAKADLDKHISELKELESAAKKFVVEVEGVTADSWHKMHQGLEQSWSKLSTAVEAIWAKASGHSTKPA